MYKKFIEGKKVVCFDLDGTIVNTLPYHVLAFEKILELANPNLSLTTVYGKAGESLTEKWGRIVDNKMVKNNMTVKELVDNTNSEFLRLISESALEPRPGFWDLQYKIKEDLGLKIALTTNTQKAVATQVINKAGIAGAFDFMVFGDDCKKYKPDPEMYIKTAKQFGVKPQEMLVFEDSIDGATAAQKSGASFIVIWDTQTEQRRFPKGALTFTDDFEGIAENLDYTLQELAENFKQRVIAWESQQTQK
jgi:beta-phosphoglucomutase